MSPYVPRLIAFSVGFLSLTQEILWTRLVSFSHLTKPQAFSLVLALYLFGIAIGAGIGRVACARGRNALGIAGVLLIAAGLADVAFLLLYASAAGTTLALPTLATAIVVTAALKSTLFPIVHHIGSNEVKTGKGSSFSRVYVSNVFGSALGPLIGGLLLLHWATLQQSFVLVSMLTLAVGCFALSHAARRTAATGAALLAGATAFCALGPNFLIPALAETGEHEGEVVALYENRSGVVHVVSGGNEGDIVFGNNVYDGRISTDLRSNKNGIHRAFALAAFHSAPRDVLVIGLSGGAWTRVISNFPGVKQIDVVEINPSYLNLVGQYAEVSPILDDPRIHFHIDDGRRWLRLHTGKYDLVVMNSIHHWRANATNLLSVEFMELAQEHLKEGGIFYVNSTDSPDVLETATAVFKHAYRFDNFVAASDHDFRENFVLNRSRVAATLAADPPAPHLTDSERKLLVSKVYDEPFLTLGEVQARASRDLEIVRDDNMITEYKFGVGFF